METTQTQAERKTALRSRIRAARRARFSGENAQSERISASRGIASSVRSVLEHWEMQGSVGQALCFVPMAFEPPLLEAMGVMHTLGVEVLVPRVLEEREMEWVRWDPESALRPSSVPGIREPEGEAVIPSSSGVLLLPALALGADGTRLGQGGGFYDSFLSDTSAPERRAAVVFREELLEEPVPAEPWDAVVSLAVTEHGVWIREGKTLQSQQTSYPHAGRWMRLL